MNLQPYNLNYQDGLNTYPIIDYINDQIVTSSGGIISSNIYTQTSNLYITNSNINGGIYFKVINSATATGNNYNYSVKIDKDGKLYVYHLYNPLNPTMGAGWYDVEGELANIWANNLAINIQFTAIEGEILLIAQQANATFDQLSRYATATNYRVNTLEDSFYKGYTKTTWQQLYQNRNNANNASFIARQLTKNGMEVQNQIVQLITQTGQAITSPQFAFGTIIFGAIIGGLVNYFNSNQMNTTLDPNYYPDYPSCNFNLSRSLVDEILTSNNSNLCDMTSNVGRELSNSIIQIGFINSNVTTTQFIPTLKSDKVLLGNITTPNASYQMEMTGDLNTNMLYINSTSLTSLLNQKQDNMSATQPIYITSSTIGLNYDSSLTKIGNNLSVVKTATTPLVWTGNDISLSYDNTLLLTAGVLGVNIPAESKWRYTGANIYNKDFTNVGIGTISIQSRLHLHQGTANTECQIRFTNAQSGTNSATDGVYLGLDASSPYNFQIDSRTATGQIRFRTGDTLRATLKSNGCLGIGIANPQQLLSVAGKLESTNGNNDKIYFSYDDANNYRHRIYANFDSSATDNNYIQIYNWRNGQSATTIGDKSVAIFHNKYTRFDGNRYVYINDVNSLITGYDHTTAPLTLFHKTATSTTVLNDSLPILNLSREGTAGQSWGARANFNICRWENAGTSFQGSRTRLDLYVAHNSYDNIFVMCWRSDGRVGIGDVNPQYKLHVQAGNTFIGDVAYNSATLTTANGHKLIFDNTYNGTAGSGNICNKILLHNTTSANVGFGYENGALVYQSGDSHSFYTGTTSTVYGTRRMLLSSAGNLNINATNNAYAKLNVNGIVNFHAGSASAVPNNYMSAGSLTIGDTAVNYGQGSGWNTNTAGLMLECLDKTEIVVHDAGNRLASLINFVGGTSSYHEYGRAYGYGYPNAHYFRCNQTFECFFNNATSGWNYFKVEPTSLWGDGLVNASDQGGTKYLTIRNVMLQAPHIVPESVGGVAFIRYGRAGGVAAGTWWETSVGVAGTFRIIREQDYKYGITITARGNIGVANDAPIDVSGDTNACSLLLGKCQGGYQHRARIHLVKDDNNGSVRQILLTQDNLFNFSICDGGGQNNINSVTFIVQVNYAAPATSLFIDSSGYVQMRLGFGLSDQRTKTNIKTIDDALFKVLQLRGVEYNDIEIGNRCIGLIAQEVEGVIPEVVHTNENTDVKSIAYGNMTGVLVNAIKELNEIVVKQNQTINNLMERLERLENGTSQGK